MIRQKVNKQKTLVSTISLIVIFVLIGYLLATKVFHVNINLSSSGEGIIDIKKETAIKIKYGNLRSINQKLFERKELDTFIDYSKNIKKRELKTGNKKPFGEEKSE